MASYVFDQVKKFVAAGTIKFDIDNYRVVLVTDAAFDPSFSSYDTWDEMSDVEITQNSEYNREGYPGHSDSAPGTQLKNVGYVLGDDQDDDGYPDVVVYSDNITYNVSTIDAAGAIILRGRTDGKYDLISALDFRTPGGGNYISSNNGVFSLLFDEYSGGFLIIK